MFANFITPNAPRLYFYILKLTYLKLEAQSITQTIPAHHSFFNFKKQVLNSKRFYIF